MIDGNSIIYTKELVLSKLSTITGMVGLPIETINTIEKLGDRIDTDDKSYNSIVHQLGNNANMFDVNNAIHVFTLKF